MERIEQTMEEDLQTLNALLLLIAAIIIYNT